jgi:hypothetical protein
MLGEESLAKKRQFAEERAARLRDPRLRTLGIDKNALDEQVRERKHMEQLERERDAYFDQQRLSMDKQAVNLQREVNTLRTQRERDAQEFRNTQQRADMRREWDLNDPQRVSGALPARVNDLDPRCGASGLQKFEGEDLDAKERKRAQQNQQQDWAKQQTEEKLVKKWAEADQQRLYEDRAEEIAYRTYQIEQAIADQRRQASKTAADFNKAVAEQKRQEKLKGRYDQTQRNLEEVENLMNSDLLMERSGGRPVRSDFKGMTHDQRSEIMRQQEEQREIARMRRVQEAEEAKQASMQEAMQTRMALTLDRQRERERRDAARQLAEDRLRQADEARSRKKELDGVYANEVTEEYFAFGKGL